MWMRGWAFMTTGSLNAKARITRISSTNTACNLGIRKQYMGQIWNTQASPSFEMAKRLPSPCAHLVVLFNGSVWWKICGTPWRWRAKSQGFLLFPHMFHEHIYIVSSSKIESWLCFCLSVGSHVPFSQHFAPIFPTFFHPFRWHCGV